MAVQRTPLQGISPSAPRKDPVEETYWEFVRKASTQAALQGLVQFGVQTGVEYATDDIQTERSINIAKAKIESQKTAEIELDARGELRGLGAGVNAQIASIDEEDQKLDGILTSVAMSSKQAYTKTGEEPAYDMGEILGVLSKDKKSLDLDIEVKNKNIAAFTTDINTLSASEAAGTEKVNGVPISRKIRSISQMKEKAESELEFLLRAMGRVDALKGTVKEVTRQLSGVRDPTRAFNLIRQRVLVHRKALAVQRAEVLRGWTDRAGLLANDIPGVSINAKALSARIENMQAAGRAKTAVRYAHERLREQWGDAKYQAWLNRGGLHNQEQDLPDFVRIPWSEDMQKRNAEFKSHFPSVLRRLYGLDSIETMGQAEYLKESYIRGTGTVDPKYESSADKSDKATRKFVGVLNIPDIDPSVLKDTQRVSPGVEEVMREQRRAPRGKYDKYSSGESDWSGKMEAPEGVSYRDLTQGMQWSQGVSRKPPVGKFRGHLVGKGVYEIKLSNEDGSYKSVGQVLEEGL